MRNTIQSPMNITFDVVIKMLYSNSDSYIFRLIHCVKKITSIFAKKIHTIENRFTKTYAWSTALVWMRDLDNHKERR